MDPRFDVVTHISFKGLYSLQKASKSNALRNIMWICSGVCIVCSMFLWIIDDSSKWGITAVALLVLCWTLFSDYLLAWISYRGTSGPVGEMHFSFDEDAVRAKNLVSEGKISYSAFVKMIENKDHYFLFVQKRAAYVLPKEDFVLGDAAQFASFMEEKTGLKVIRR